MTLKSDVARLRAWLDQTFVGQCLTATIELRPFDKALALSSRAFIALIPLAILLSSISPAQRDGGFAEGLIERFELEGAGAEAVRRLFATPEEVRGGTTALGVLVLLYSVFSFGRLLGRIYEEAWGLPRAGVRGAGRALVWIVGFAAFLTFVLPLRDALREVTLLGPTIVLASSSVLWLWTPTILLTGRVPWRMLVPTGVLSAVGLALYGAASAVYLPESVTTSAQRYGLVGVAFSLLSWLIGYALVVVVAAAIGAVAGRRGFGVPREPRAARARRDGVAPEE